MTGCICAACKKHFASVEGFDRHRTGYFAARAGETHNRGCMDSERMLNQGWTFDKGNWRSPKESRKLSTQREARAS